MQVYEAYSEAAVLIFDAGQVAKNKGVGSIEFADANRRAADALRKLQKLKELFGVQ